MRVLSIFLVALAAVFALSGCAKKPLCEAYKSCCDLAKSQGKDVAACMEIPSTNKACDHLLPLLMQKMRKAGGNQLHGMCSKMWQEALDRRDKKK